MEASGEAELVALLSTKHRRGFAWVKRPRSRACTFLVRVRIFAWVVTGPLRDMFQLLLDL